MELLILDVVLKEITNSKAIYYYEANKFVEDFNSAGIVEFDLSILNNVFDQTEDIGGYVLSAVIDKKIVVIKDCKLSYLSGDGIDFNAIRAVTYILKRYIEEKNLPRKNTRIFEKMIEMLVNTEGGLDIIRKCGNVSEEQIEDYKIKYLKTEEQ